MAEENLLFIVFNTIANRCCKVTQEDESFKCVLDKKKMKDVNIRLEYCFYDLK